MSRDEIHFWPFLGHPWVKVTKVVQIMQICGEALKLAATVFNIYLSAEEGQQGKPAAALCFSKFQFETSQRSSPSSQDFASLCEQILEKLWCFYFFQMPNGPKV